MKLRVSAASLVVFALAPWCAQAQQPASTPEKVIGELYATDATLKGSVVLAAGGMQVMDGAQVSAGSRPAELKLRRGGELRICSATQVTIAASPSGRELMFSLSGGALETHYELAATADAIITPDFRLQLVGPGEFHFAVGADPRGNTCIKALQRNTASLIVTESLGDSAYQVKPDEMVYFRHGRIAGATREEAADCGCPAPLPVMRASAAESAPAADSSLTRPLPAPTAGDVQVQIDAPFVFRGDEPQAPRWYEAEIKLAQLPTTAIPLPQPALVRQVLVQTALPQRDVLAANPAPRKKRGFFGRIRGVFAAIFGGG